MTINSRLRRIGRPTRSARAASRSEPIAVGEVDSHVFNCPRCTRPLATGTLACPACGTHLLFGVRASVGLGLMATGLAIGVLMGGGGVYLARPHIAGGLAGDGSGTLPSSVSGTVGTDPSPAPLQPDDIGVPSGAVSALRQAAILDARLTAQARELRVVLKRKSSVGIDVARILRSLNSDATFGVILAPAIGPWPEAAKLSYDLGSFYRAVRDSSQSSLQVSLTETAAYRAAGKRMATLLAKLPALDAAAAAVVADAGLAPLVEPVPTAPAAP